MRITSVLRNDPMHVHFVIEDGALSYVNALRRVIISDILVPAIHSVDIQRNETDFVPEVLAHQIGMVAVRVPESVETATLTLDLHNESGGMQKVYARDLVARDAGVNVVHPETLLGYMAPGQRLRLVARTRWGTVREHAKWTCCHCTFSYVPRVSVHQSRPLSVADRRRARRMCPNGVFDIEDGALLATRPERCTFCGECASIMHTKEGVDVVVDSQPGAFLFEVESYGVFTAAQILEKATRILEQRLVAVMHRVERDLPRLPQTPPTSPTDGLHSVLRAQGVGQ